MARQKGLVQSRFGSVKPSPAMLVRIAFESSSPPTWRLCFGTPEGTRTPGLLLRRQLLYPTELLAHVKKGERVTGIGPA